MRRSWLGWVSIWDAREAPHVLAVVRILVGAVLLYDLSQLLMLDLAPGLFGPMEAGGIGNPLGRKQAPLLYQWFAAESGTAVAAVWVAVVAAAMVMLGLGTRLAALVLVLVLTQLAQVLPPADRGIDMLLRNVLMVLMMSGCARTWSIDARLRSGRWSGDGVLVPSWPRLLLVCQMLLLYSTAGAQKVGLTWLPMGDWSALYIVLRDPAFAVLSPATLDRFYVLTQVATLTSWLWEWATPLAAMAWWYRATRIRPGRVRAWMNSHGFWWKWVAVGAFFHVGTGLLMRLGIFPLGMLAIYPCFFHPQTWASLRRRKPPATA
jgi:uncharacterized membrane protein YphA (DoxX/SURF4 family)